MSLVSTVEQQSHHDVVAQAVLQRRGEERVADHSEVRVHICAVGQQQLHEVVPAERHESSQAPQYETAASSVYLSARTATRMHRRGSSSVLAPAASSNLAQVTSPLETAKNKGVFLRSP